MSWYLFLADVVVFVHIAYVSFIVLGQLVILLGIALRWRWVRNPTFRVAHLIAILIVAFEAIVGIRCPLTTMEDKLREWAGQTVDSGTFIGRLLDGILFHTWPSYVFTLCYVGFAVLVLLTLTLAPPRWRRMAR
jgi:hypothetical protein